MSPVVQVAALQYGFCSQVDFLQEKKEQKVSHCEFNLTAFIDVPKCI